MFKPPKTNFKFFIDFPFSLGNFMHFSSSFYFWSLWTSPKDTLQSYFAKLFLQSYLQITLFLQSYCKVISKLFTKLFAMLFQLVAKLFTKLLQSYRKVIAKLLPSYCKFIKIIRNFLWSFMAILNKMTPNLGRSKAKQLNNNTSVNISRPTTDFKVFENFAEVHLRSYCKVIAKLLQGYYKVIQNTFKVICQVIYKVISTITKNSFKRWVVDIQAVCW